MHFGPFQHDVRVSAREPSMHLQKPQVWVHSAELFQLLMLSNQTVLLA